MATLTSNKNYLSPVGFKFTIDNQLYPNLEYFCTAVSLPSISIAEAPMPFRGANVGFTGDRITFDDLSVKFNITEDMDNYKETFDWIHNIVNVGEQFKSDAILSILTSHNNVSKTIRFSDVFPISLSGVEFTTGTTEIEYLQADVTFKYTSFEFI